MTVENLSGRVLGSPQVHVRCGWPDDLLGEVVPLNSTMKEIFLFHNFKKSEMREASAATMASTTNTDKILKFISLNLSEYA